MLRLLFSSLPRWFNRVRYHLIVLNLKIELVSQDLLEMVATWKRLNIIERIIISLIQDSTKAELTLKHQKKEIKAQERNGLTKLKNATIVKKQKRTNEWKQDSQETKLDALQVVLGLRRVTLLQLFYSFQRFKPKQNMHQSHNQLITLHNCPSVSFRFKLKE